MDGAGAPSGSAPTVAKTAKRKHARRPKHAPAAAPLNPPESQDPPEQLAGAGEAPSSAGVGGAEPMPGQPDAQAELDQAFAAGEAERPEPPPPPPPQLDPAETETVAKVSEFVETMDREQPAGADHAQLLTELTAEDVADFLKLGFSLVAFKRGDHWVLSDQEAEHIGRWVRKAIARHGVEWVAKWLPDIMAGALLGYAIVRRVEVDNKLAAQRKAATKDKAAEGGAQ